MHYTVLCDVLLYDSYDFMFYEFSITTYIYTVIYLDGLLWTVKYAKSIATDSVTSEGTATNFLGSGESVLGRAFGLNFI